MKRELDISTTTGRNKHMNKKFHTFTAAPLFTSADAEEVKVEAKESTPKYKAGDIVYLSYQGNKYIITVDRFEEPNKIWSKYYEYKFEDMENYGVQANQSASGFFNSDEMDGSKIHPSLESLEGLAPVKIGDTVYLTLNQTQFIVNVTEITEDGYYGNYKVKELTRDWTDILYRGLFLIDRHGYKRHASQHEMQEAANKA